MEQITTLFIFIAIIATLFLIFRSILLWFWKVDKQVELLEKNNKLLEDILINLQPKISKIDSNESITIEKSDVKKAESLETEIEIELSKEIKELTKTLKTDELIIEDKKTGELSIIKKSKHETDKELHLSHTYKVIYTNE